MLKQSLGRVANMGRTSSLKMADRKGTADLALHELNKARGNVRTANMEYYPVAVKQYNKAKKKYATLKQYGK